MYGSNKKRVNLNSKFNPTNSYAKFRVEAYNYMLKKRRNPNQIWSQPYFLIMTPNIESKNS